MVTRTAAQPQEEKAMTQTDALARPVVAEPARPAAPDLAPREPLSPEELRERARKRGAAMRTRGGIDLSPERIKALIEEGRP